MDRKKMRQCLPLWDILRTTKSMVQHRSITMHRISCLCLAPRCRRSRPFLKFAAPPCKKDFSPSIKDCLDSTITSTSSSSSTSSTFSLFANTAPHVQNLSPRALTLGSQYPSATGACPDCCFCHVKNTRATRDVANSASPLLMRLL